ncbi:MAG TPA: hypothetical protein VG937_06705 [Polyangiaceae bacterium]|nr:hypothetical protein [Polyangiaceae bacterium]
MERPLADPSALAAAVLIEPQQSGWRCPTSWLVSFYAFLFALVAWSLDVSWSRLTPVPLGRELAPHARRYYVMHEDTVNAQVSIDVRHEGLHLRASGLRGEGLVLATRAPSFVVERACPLGSPHVHPAEPDDEQLGVEFQAKSPLRGSAIAVATRQRQLAHGPGRLPPRRLRYNPDVKLDAEWRTYFVPVEAEPTGDTEESYGAGRIEQIQLEFNPRTRVDLMIRDLRAVRVLRAEQVSQRTLE